MNPDVRFSAEAVTEFEDAASWYDGQDAGLGERFLHAVEATVDLIVRWPLAGRIMDDLPTDPEVRRSLVARFPYHVAYIVLNDRLQILAIAHDRRRPTYWAPRAVPDQED